MQQLLFMVSPFFYRRLHRNFFSGRTIEWCL